MRRRLSVFKMSLCLLAPVCAAAGGAFGQATAAPVFADAAEEIFADREAATYADTLFDTSYVHEIGISISEWDWADLLETPLESKKYRVDVTVDGEVYRDVSLATKGNSSLTMVVDEGGDRFSFKLNFGKYNKGQTLRGLDKLALNNNFKDPTNMKDYLCYRFFREVGVPAPLASFARLTVNGKVRGLYLAVEVLEDSFIERTFGGGGALYKPDSGALGADSDLVNRIRETCTQTEDYSNGANLLYVDDRIGSYPDIFENNETKTNEEDERRVIRALKALSERKDLEQYLDTAEIIRYFAVQNFTRSFDSYIGPMLHNYYLYEKEGRLSMLPWDYNNAFASFGLLEKVLTAEPVRVLNKGIDSPLLGALEGDRPMWEWIVESEDYRAEYHAVLDAFVRDYFESGSFEQEMAGVYERILPYVQEDPTAFYTPEKFTDSYQKQVEFILRRAESVRRQLDGELATRDDLQESEDMVETEVGFEDLT